MTRFRAPRAARSAALIACLGLFLLGSNYCLLSTWTGNGDMACMKLPAPDAAAKGCGRCAGHGAEQQDPAQRSCCPAPVVAPATPMIEKASAASPAFAVVALAIDPPATPALSSHRGRPVASESPPPARLVRAPLPARAPPLA